MPKARKLTAHPAHLALLFHMVNGGQATTIDALRTAGRVLDAIDKAVTGGPDRWVEWVDPAQIRTAEEWERARKAQPVADDHRRWDVDARETVVLSEDEFAHARRCFDAAVGRAKGLDARGVLALLDALDAAEKVEAGV